ncbi:hypothetical protein HQ544_05520 [Candidatus Falkowbacteria bacterium]|nr:hypothetical protein [Candidatus Falkowbacteria bacterium]
MDNFSKSQGETTLWGNGSLIIPPLFQINNQVDCWFRKEILKNTCECLLGNRIDASIEAS